MNLNEPILDSLNPFDMPLHMELFYCHLTPVILGNFQSMSKKLHLLFRYS